MSSIHTLMTQPYHYEDKNSVRRLSPSEQANPQLRPDNKFLKRYMEYPTLPKRRDNPQAIREERTNYLTDYANEAPIVRSHNNAMIAGGDFWSGLENVVSGAVPIISKIL